MKRLIVILILALATAAFAQTARHIEMHPMANPEEHAAAVAEYLQLTPDQKAVWEGARNDASFARDAAVAKSRAAEDELHSLLEAKSADACAVGSAMLKLHAAHAELAAVDDGIQAKVVAVLTPEQKAKFDALHAARSFGEHKMIEIRSPK